ncbi:MULTISPECIES: phage tail assembly chaperone [unclassified Iodidimonas]|jgi:hypothetical protein|uniref:phage tail assembly chaperone n=2 Tax=Iodidimonas TaxID=2066486 RepID=UPI002482BD65|nr:MULTISPECIES: phage tail assembly chaperone [unclassified Iodidimonas]
MMPIKADRPDPAKTDCKRLDFRKLAGFAMVRMGWSAEAFWSSTPADFLMALDALDPHIRALPDGGMGSFFDHQDLDRLMQRFPDQTVDADRLKTS